MQITDTHLREKVLLISILIFILSITAGWYFIKSRDEFRKQQQETALKNELSDKANTIAQIINHRFVLLYGVRAFILTSLEHIDETGHGFSSASSNLFLKTLYSTIPDIYSVTISPNGIHQHVYPVTESTKKTLGHNLLTDKRPQVREKVQQTINNKTIGLSGPYPLRQDGSLGLIARLPVYQNNKFWGFTVMVLNVPKLLKIGEIELTSDFALRIAGGNTFYGDPKVFDGNPQLSVINLPDGQWELAKSSVPLTNMKVVLLILNSLFALLLSSLFYFFYTRNWYLQAKVEKATKTLREQEEVLRQGREKYRRFFSTVTHGWAYHKIITDDDGRPIDYIFLEVNAAFEKLTGLSKDTIIGKRVTEVLPEIEIDPFRWIEKYGDVALSGNSISFENYSEQLQRWYSVSASCPQQDYFITVFDDITKRKKTEATLIKANEIINRSPAVAIQWRNETHWPIAFISENIEQLVGYSKQEFLDGTVSYFGIVHQDDSERVAHEVASYSLKQDQTEFTHTPYRLITKEGHSIWVEDRSYINRDSEGNITHYEGIIYDITEREQADAKRLEMEDQLRQKHKMEAVGYMAGGMAHNFNNNLGIILGNVELSQLRVQDPKVKELLKNAKIAILRSRDLVGQIITYSRKGIQSKAPMQLWTIVDETITLLSSTLPTTINLQKIVSPACDGNYINADASQVQEILVNLCNNAVQAMDETGDLTISLEPVELSQAEIPAQYDGISGRYAKLSVQDSGCGMPTEMLDKIFDPFFTTKEDYEGAGMGLATVQGIVAQHGGVIKVNSIPNQGTAFNIYFPIIDKTVTETETQPINGDMPKGTEKILFVDDDEQLAKLGEKLLSEMGYQVVTMIESTEALKLFTANPDHFDMVITDQTMPELTGEDLIQELKKIRPDLKTILCTGFSSKIDEDQAKQQGIDAFCMKPLDLPELLQTVRLVLDGGEK